MCDSENDPRSQIIHMKKIQAEGLELFIKKNSDYGNSYKQYGLIGVLVRLQDKINRCLHITKNGIQVNNESLRDTLIDLHNYAAMALMESESEPTVPNLPKDSTAPNLPKDSTAPNLPKDSTVPNLTIKEKIMSVYSSERTCIDQCINLR
jgi:hypothetical protein